MQRKVECWARRQYRLAGWSQGFGEWAAGRDITSVSFWGQMGFKVQLQQYVLFAKLKD